MPLDSIIITPEAYQYPANDVEKEFNRLVEQAYGDAQMRIEHKIRTQVKMHFGKVYFINYGWTHDGFRVIATLMTEQEFVEMTAGMLETIYPDDEPPFDIEATLNRYESGIDDCA
jgi:hypothetical protein